MSLQLVIVSGRSGSGKSAALGSLEDNGYLCIDNLPVGVLHSTCVWSKTAARIKKLPLELMPEVALKIWRPYRRSWTASPN